MVKVFVSLFCWFGHLVGLVTWLGWFDILVGFALFCLRFGCIVDSVRIFGWVGDLVGYEIWLGWTFGGIIHFVGL